MNSLSRPSCACIHNLRQLDRSQGLEARPCIASPVSTQLLRHLQHRRPVLRVRTQTPRRNSHSNKQRVRRLIRRGSEPTVNNVRQQHILVLRGPRRQQGDELRRMPPHYRFQRHHAEAVHVAFLRHPHCICKLCTASKQERKEKNKKDDVDVVAMRDRFRTRRLILPGATYPRVPARAVQLDESGLSSLAVPKSETQAL